jgi:hypothetical protein
MKIIITEEQSNIIQEEIIKLEEELPLLYEYRDGWAIVNNKGRTEELKSIIKNQYIEL